MSSRLKNLGLALVLACVASIAQGFDAFPTTITHRHDSSSFTRADSKLLEALFSDGRLSEAVEMLEVSPDGRRMQSLLGKLSEPLTGATTDAVRGFIGDHSRLFNLPPGRSTDALTLTRHEEQAGVDHLTFQLFHSGIPVRDARIQIHVGTDRAIHLIQGSLPTLVSVATRSTLSSK